MMNCSACGGIMKAFLTTRDRNRGVSNDAFRYERCPQCGLISLDNVPDDLDRYYAADYHDAPSSAADIERGAQHDRYKIDLVRSFMSRGRVLEIGPGWGAFCLLAKRAGFGVQAIEMDSRCAEFLRAQLGVRAIRSDDPAAALEQVDPPDLIALWHVFEHMRDPWALLEVMARKIASRGALLVATPNPDATQFRLFGSFWTHLDAPRHVHLIPSRVLSERMAKLGFQPELLTYGDLGSLGWNDFGWRFSFANLTPLPAFKRPMRLAGRLVGRLAAPLDHVEGKGSAYTVVFRKAA